MPPTPEPEQTALTLRMPLPRPLTLTDLGHAVEQAMAFAPAGATAKFVLHEIGTQRDPETAVVGLVVSWTVADGE